MSDYYYDRMNGAIVVLGAFWLVFLICMMYLSFALSPAPCKVTKIETPTSITTLKECPK